EMMLVEVEHLSRVAGLERAPYIPYFETDMNIIVQDASYLFDCVRGGPYMIYISRMAPTGPRQRYQAVFA
ncbi:hypothetical protein ABTM57_20960, partial [Acinetobacter baumannii]